MSQTTTVVDSRGIELNIGKTILLDQTGCYSLHVMSLSQIHNIDITGLIIDSCDFICCIDGNGFNADSWMLRECEESFTFLKNVAALEGKVASRARRNRPRSLHESSRMEEQYPVLSERTSTGMASHGGTTGDRKR